jgi:hypothetical protein
VWDGQAFGPLKVLRQVELRGTDGEPRRFTVETEVAGTSLRIAGEAVGAFPYTLLRPTGMLAGYCPPDDETIIDVECPARYDWDGASGYGWIGRSRRAKELHA